MSSQTPSKRGKYANDEERKAAARERQRLYAARKRAEAKEAKLRELGSQNEPNGAEEPATPTFVAVNSPVADDVPVKPKRSTRKAAAEATATGNAAVPAATPRKRATRRKNEEAVNGDALVHEDIKLEDSRLEDTVSDFSSFAPSFSEGLTYTSFIPPEYHPTDYLLIPPQPSPTLQLHSFSHQPIQRYAIIHIPGNPGVVSYYTKFLTSLASNLSEIPHSEFFIFGQSIAGYNLGKPPQGSPSFIKLEDQITRQIDIITHLLTNNPDIKLIVTCHSLGAYLFLSALHHFSLHNLDLKKRIIGGIHLFPAVTHLAKSPSGRKFAPFINIPGLFPLLVFIANFLILIIPAFIWHGLLKIFMPAFEDYAREATVNFLKSPRGVKQGLYLAQDELRRILDDKFGTGVWGDSDDVDHATELVFYFGEKDHWVFDDERDRIIKERGRGGVRWVDGEEVVVEKEGWKPKMLVCAEGVRHSYCVSTAESELMAAKAAKWVEEIVENDRRGGF